MSRFTIHPAAEQDIALILKLITELARYEKMESYVNATEQSLHDSLFVKKTANALILEHDKNPIGYAIYFYNFSSFEGRAGLYVEDIYIRPQYRKNGYGKKVFAYLADVACKNNCARMEWVCLDWNAPSLEFYQKLGTTTHSEWIIHRLKGEHIENLAAYCAE